jgi:uncharacterized protein with HEPN domain
MIEAAEAALRFASGRSRRDLDDDEMLTFALTRVIGMRHRLVHAYFDVDRAILWSTVQEALPRLLAQLERE